jgi:hypothetical protein
MSETWTQIFSSSTWDPNNPRTFPTVWLPYTKAGRNLATQLDDLIEYVQFQGQGAVWVARLQRRALGALSTKEERRELRQNTFVWWPFNFTKTGDFKMVAGMTEEERREWRDVKRAYDAKRSLAVRTANGGYDGSSGGIGGLVTA